MAAIAADDPAVLAEQKPEDVLNDPCLFNRIVIDEFDKKIIGEYDARRTMFLAGCMCYVTNSDATSSNLLINAESGSGKDYVGKNVFEIFPKHMYYERCKLTKEVFTYWGDKKRKKDPSFSWDGKIMFLEDIGENILNSTAFKTMTSGGKFATVVKDQDIIELDMCGKPVMIITTANSEPNTEMLRRFPIAMLNETEEQTRAIIVKKCEDNSLACDNRYSKNVTEALDLLERVEVGIPFAPDIGQNYPSGSLMSRTGIGRFLDMIKASAALHQWQRVVDRDRTKRRPKRILANALDYEIARKVLMSMNVTDKGVNISRKRKALLDVAKEYRDPEWTVEDTGWIAAAKFEKKISMSHSSFQKALEWLKKHHFIEMKLDDSIGRPVKMFKVLTTTESIILPKFDELSAKISAS